MARALSPSLVRRRVCGDRACPDAARVGAASSVVAEANQVIKDRAPGWSARKRRIALGIARLETDFGVSGSWLMPDGTPSYNWGALVGVGTAGSITHGDKTAEGTPTTVQFQAFHNMSEAFDAFRKVWTRGDVKGDKSIPHETTVDAAADRGDAYNVARTMYAHRYFTGVKGSDDDRILAYAKAIVAAAAEVGRQLGEPIALDATPSGIETKRSALWWAVPAIVIVGGVALLKYGATLQQRWEYYTS